MNWKKDNTESDDAVTSVVGEILLMALVIILVSLFAASAFDLLPGDRQSAVDVSMEKETDTVTFWHKGGDWIDGSELSASLTEADGTKHVLETESLQDCFGEEKRVFDLGGSYTVKLPPAAAGTVSIRLTSADSVLYAWEGKL
ncbi:MAG: type IV pilin N-terminal domain-containing protein [Methanocorpusculum sp.]|nr:type IV pilin N-terminal domain-containing protein [Methanocorpusculum sp.]